VRLKPAISKKSIKKRFLYLGKELLDLLGVQGAAVSDLAQVGVLDQFSDLGSGGVLELGGQGGYLLVEKGQELVVVGDGTGGQVADETAVTLGGLGVGQDGESSIGFSLFDITAMTFAASGGQESGSKDEALEEDGTSQETEGGGGTSGEGDGAGGGGGSGGGADDEGGLGDAGQSQESDSRDGESVHV